MWGIFIKSFGTKALLASSILATIFNPCVSRAFNFRGRPDPSTSLSGNLHQHVPLISSQRQLPLPLCLLDLVDPLPGEEQRGLHVVLVAQRARHRQAQRLVTDVPPASVSARHLQNLCIYIIICGLRILLLEFK